MPESDLSIILNELCKPAQLNDIHRRIQLCMQALTMIPRQQNPRKWAALQGMLADSLTFDPLGERADNFERAIHHYREALNVFSRETYPEDWATTQVRLAIAYHGRIRGERADNLEHAIHHCEEALKVRTRDAYPEDWASTQNNLGSAYLNRIRGDRADNVERAIHHYRETMNVFSRKTFPEDWARTQSNLGSAYSDRTRGDRADNVERAIHHCEEALKVRTREAYPEDWASTQNTLGSAYRNRIRGEHADNLERAIHHYRESLDVFIREAFPEDWARTQNNLGAAYSDRIRGERADNLERAIYYYLETITVFSNDAFPEEWARTQNNLGAAYSDRIRGERADNLERAIHHCGEALNVFSRKAFPEDWARTQNFLGCAYSNRIRGERADNLERAIHHCGEALNVFSRKAFPEDWARIQNNIGSAYSNRIRGDHADNLKRAIHHYRESLHVFSREAFPEDWARTQHNLAATYRNSIGDERADNLERAIHHYRESLKEFSREAFPENWARTQSNLAAAYWDRIAGERADNIENAVHHYREALKVLSREAFPENWARTQHNLAAAYWDRIAGESADNIEHAIHHYGEALKVFSREAFPLRYLITQRCLGHLHFERGNWAPAHTAHTAAIQAGVDLLAAAYTEAGRQAEVGETASLYADDAYTLLRLGRLGDALVRLELGKTRLLSEALALAALDLTILAEADQEAVRSARQAVRELEAEMRLPADTPASRSDRGLADILSQARGQLNRLIERIRSEHPEFMPTGLDLRGLLDLIPKGGALVAPLFTSQGSATFVLPYGTAAVTPEHVIELDRFTTADLRVLLHGADDAPEPGGWLGAYANSDDDRQGWLAAIETTCRELWEGLIGPVHERLVDLGLTQGAPVLLMPQSGLGLLPVHAAWREVDGQKRCLLDDWSVIYAPSGYAISVSRERLKQAARQGQALLAVVNPTEDLPFTPAEAEAAMPLFADAQALKEAEATVAAMIEAAPGRQYLHVAGHGFYDWRNALLSGLVMADKPLTLAMIISELDLRSCRLVTLSACETGITDIRHSPDEFFGLPAGLLQAGAPAVVSTLWPVDDLSTMLLMERFYKHLLADNHRTPHPAAALRAAQLWLREATAGELNLHERWRQVYQTTKDRDFAKTAFRNIRYFANHQDEKPFTSPYFWAGFTFAGF